MLVEVAVRSPLRRLFTYESDEKLQKGMRVRVPFGSREILGVVWRETELAPKGLKKVAKILDESSFFDEATLSFYEKAAHYYGISLGDILHQALPKKIQEGKSLAIPLTKILKPDLFKLSDPQEKILRAIMGDKTFRTHLLMGETGSGKTEVYLHAFVETLKAGGQSLFLVPEISLTPQFEARLKERLGESVTIFHSKVSEKRREEAFARALYGEPGIFLGARSALFLPFKNLKFIVVDEEHDSSYKQSERGCYHARDLAILRAKLFNHPIVLGSATPSLESFHRAKEANEPIYELKPYYEKAIAEIEVLDLKTLWKTQSKSFITEQMQSALEENLTRGEQSLLFLNRRGSASQRICIKCGETAKCKNCSTSLTLHKDLFALVCHWCEYKVSSKSKCSDCGESEFFDGGIGTKELELQVKARFPEARVARLDRDEAQKSNQLEKIIEEFSSGKIDILIGTQMVSKGLDIPNLSLVGVVLADLGWGVPDFRGMERAFQLLHQLCGRAGRRGQKYRLLIQTFSPTNPLFDWLKSAEPFQMMAETELATRRLAQMPPYNRLALWTLSHRDQKLVEAEANILVKRMKTFAAHLKVEVWGPTPAPVSRWKGQWRLHILSRADPKGQLTSFQTAILDEIERLGLKSKLKLDRDPYHFL